MLKAAKTKANKNLSANLSDIEDKKDEIDLATEARKKKSLTTALIALEKSHERQFNLMIKNELLVYKKALAAWDKRNFISKESG